MVGEAEGLTWDPAALDAENATEGVKVVGYGLRRSGVPVPGRDGVALQEGDGPGVRRRPTSTDLLAGSAPRGIVGKQILRFGGRLRVETLDQILLVIDVLLTDNSASRTRQSGIRNRLQPAKRVIGIRNALAVPAPLPGEHALRNAVVLGRSVGDGHVGQVAVA